MNRPHKPISSRTGPSTVTSNPKAAADRAMTLIEMVAVMALMSLLITMGVLSFHAWTRGSSLRTATVQVLSGLGSARQLALTHRGIGRFSAYNLKDRGAFSLYLDTNTVAFASRDPARDAFRLVGITNRLPRGVTFQDLPQPGNLLDLFFHPDGAGAGADPFWPHDGHTQQRLILTDARGAGGLATTVTVERLTGYTRIETGE